MTRLDRLIRVLFKLIDETQEKFPDRDFTDAREQTTVLCQLLRLAAIGSGDWEIVEFYTELIKRQALHSIDPTRRAGYQLVLDAIEKEFNAHTLN